MLNFFRIVIKQLLEPCFGEPIYLLWDLTYIGIVDSVLVKFSWEYRNPPPSLRLLPLILPPPPLLLLGVGNRSPIPLGAVSPLRGGLLPPRAFGDVLLAPVKGPSSTYCISSSITYLVGTIWIYWVSVHAVEWHGRMSKPNCFETGGFGETHPDWFLFLCQVTLPAHWQRTGDQFRYMLMRTCDPQDTTRSLPCVNRDRYAWSRNDAENVSLTMRWTAIAQGSRGGSWVLGQPRHQSLGCRSICSYSTSPPMPGRAKCRSTRTMEYVTAKPTHAGESVVLETKRAERVTH